MLIRPKSCEDAKYNYITLVIQIYKYKTRARRQRAPSSYFISSTKAIASISLWGYNNYEDRKEGVIMDKLITIYHGSENIIAKPEYGKGRLNNDFGQGFYCTASEALAKEWAVSSMRNGFANCYMLDTEFLNVLNLNTPQYTILNWIAILIEHRLFTVKTPVARRAKQYLIDNFTVNVNAYDLIIGYRADDSYFDYAESFINNGISVQQLARAMRLGKLGEQIVVKSSFAFSKLQFQGYSVAERERYYQLRKDRDDEANRLYWELLEEENDGLYIQDIIRGGIKNDDARIPRNVSE